MITTRFKYISKSLTGYYWNDNLTNISFSNSQIQKNLYVFEKHKNNLDKNKISEAILRFAYRKGRLYQLLNKFDLSIENYKISLKSNSIMVVFKSLIFFIILKIKLYFVN